MIVEIILGLEALALAAILIYLVILNSGTRASVKYNKKLQEATHPTAVTVSQSTGSVEKSTDSESRPASELKTPEVQKDTSGKFQVYKDNAGKFRFRLKAANGEIIASGEAYNSKNACMNGIESVKKNAPIAEIKDLTQ